MVMGELVKNYDGKTISFSENMVKNIPSLWCKENKFTAGPLLALILSHVQ